MKSAASALYCIWDKNSECVSWSALPVQRHITGYWKIPGYLTKNTRVFFSTPVLLTNTRVFSIKYPGIWQPVKYPGKWQLMTAETTCGLFRRISGVLSFTHFSLSSSLMLDVCNLYTALLELKKLRGLREWLLNCYYWKGASRGGGGKGQTMDYTIVHGQTVSRYRCETICLKDFEVVTSWMGDVVRVYCSQEYRWRIRFLFGVIPSVAISDWISYAW